MKPRYKHDCEDECIFVGQLDEDDVWFHQRDGYIEVIRRHSSEPSDYGCWGTNIPVTPPENYQEAIALVVKYKCEN